MYCHFCRHNTKKIDFIKSRKKTGLCSYHQKQIARAIKRARELALLSYTKK